MIDFYRFTHENMMKKNLFLLVSFYFFVLQAVFVWLLRWETNFYRLAVVNFVFIVVIAFFSKEKIWDVTGNPSVKKTEVEKAEKIKKIQKVKTYKPIPHIWLFVISILFGFFVWFRFGNIALSLQLLVSVLWSFVLFILFGLLFKFTIAKVRETKVYAVILAWLLLWSGIVLLNLSNISFDFLSIDNYFANTDNIEVNLDENVDSDIDNATWTDILFVSVDGDITWSVADLVFADENQDDEIVSDVDLDVNATFEDVIKTLMDQNEIIFNTATNIKFTYVSSLSEDYAYYRTAYDKKMIGKTINPTKTLLCETYIVMKWLVEGRNVWLYSDIKKAYWSYAQDNQKLSTCEYGSYIKIWDLK